jgi:hypothetical protein
MGYEISEINEAAIRESYSRALRSKRGEKGVRNRFPPSMYPLVSRPPENGS